MDAPVADTTRGGRSPAGLLGALLAAVLLLGSAGCGDDASEETTTGAGDAGTVTSTALDPPDGTPTIPDLPRNDDPSMVVCTGPAKDAGQPGVFDATAVVGDPIGEAEEAAAKQGCQVRVAVIDGEPQALTEDFRPDRVNVAIEDGEVSEIVSIG